MSRPETDGWLFTDPDTGRERRRPSRGRLRTLVALVERLEDVTDPDEWWEGLEAATAIATDLELEDLYEALEKLTDPDVHFEPALLHAVGVARRYLMWEEIREIAGRSRPRKSVVVSS